MMPIQNVRLSDLDGVLNTRNSDLVFPTFNPSSDLFHVWQSAALKKINNHHRLGGYMVANADGSLTLDDFMPLPEQAVLVDSLKDTLPHWFWDLHVPDTWELRNKGVDIWEQLTLEHGIVASITAEKEQISWDFPMKAWKRSEPALPVNAPKPMRMEQSLTIFVLHSNFYWHLPCHAKIIQLKINS